jgi:diaminohydroxyphosphoribosylaminopyrimidine deaminase/5-amino-6-(5-phosphoribosylamino)uracil reductase
MRRALDLARLGWGQTAPNPMVGAVVVRDDDVVGTGHHPRFGEPHAEVLALREAGERARGATLFVTLEPCSHTGKTPPCVDAIMAAGIARVVIATRDPNPIAGGGVETLRSAGVDVTVGVEEAAARELNAPFLHAFASDRPWTMLKLAVTLDGAITDANRSSAWLTGPAARRVVHEMRAGADAIAVGIGTALVDDPLLTVRDVEPPRVAPRRVVFDRQARLPLTSKLVRSAREIPVIVVAREPDGRRAEALRAAGVEVIDAPDAVAGLRALASLGIRSLLVEGGAALSGGLLGGGLVDRLIIFQAPIVLGEGALDAFAHLPATTVAEARRYPIVEHRVLGDDLMTIYAVGSL